jgi:hypothetical protein
MSIHYEWFVELIDQDENINLEFSDTLEEALKIANERDREDYPKVSVCLVRRDYRNSDEMLQEQGYAYVNLSTGEIESRFGEGTFDEFGNHRGLDRSVPKKFVNVVNKCKSIILEYNVLT